MGKSKKELLGARIKELRQKKNLTQNDLGGKINIDPKHLSRIELGKHYPSLDTLEKMADALRVELKDFFEFVHDDNNTIELKKKVNELVDEADNEMLKLLVRMINAMVR